MDTRTYYLGLPLRSPIVPSASPLAENPGNLRRMEDEGAGAVVLQSLFEEQIKGEARLLQDLMMQGSHSYAEAISYVPDLEEFRVGPEEYLEQIDRAKAALSIPVIASLNGQSLGGWTRFARQIEQAGADAIELNLYRIPTNPNVASTRIEQDYLDVVRAVKSVVTIPVALKLSPFFTNMAYTAASFDHAGADALVLFNRFYQPDLDIENLEVVPRVLLSSPHEMRLPLTWIGILYGHLRADLAATTGVSCGTDVVKLIMAGAAVTQICSVLLREGIGALGRINTELTRWMEEHEYESVQQMQGCMSQKNCPDPGAFERTQYMKAISRPLAPV